MYTLKFSKLYDSDVDESYNYIKNTLEAPMAANNLIKGILEKLQKIKENPHRRPLVQDSYLASLGYRIINVKNYMIFYIIDDDKKQIKVVRFMYNKRDWVNLLKEETTEK
jgi:plasmid stabilization system protein ParE